MQKSFVPDPGEIRMLNFSTEKTGIIGISLEPEQRDFPLRPLHGLCNYAPIQNAGITCRLPISDMLRELKIPYCYFHDAAIENPGWDVIDVSRIFPIFTADANDPANYRFKETDLYLQQVIDAGTEVIFRLGESIEIAPEERLRVNPPADFEKWADICINIARHYTQGWANGFYWNIRDWAIWEEPNNPNLWTGKFEDYLRLYEVTALKFKAALPDLRIGGPETTTLGIRFLDQFLAFCREKELPLDFVCYTAYYHTPAEIIAETFKRREILDKYGFQYVPMWINEWHASPVWQSFADHTGYLSETDRVRGFDGAVFAGTVLCGLHDTPVERACYYAVAVGCYGLFDERRLPTAQYFIFEKYAGMFNNAVRRIALSVDGDEPNVRGLAVLSNSGNIEIMLGCYLKKSRTVNLTLPEGFKVESIEFMNKLNPEFAKMKKWDFQIDGKIVSFPKSEEPEAFFIRLIPER